MSIRELPLDDARSWGVEDALRSALDVVTPEHTQVIIIMRDQRNQDTQIIRAGTDDFQSLGLLHWAQHLQCDDMRSESDE